MMDPALEQAIRNDDLGAFTAALESGANPNQGDDVYTPLTMLAEETPEENGVKMIDLLLKAGADANLKALNHDEIPLEYAVLQLQMFKHQNGSKKDLERVKEVMKLLCPATTDANLYALNKQYNGVMPTSCTIHLKPELRAGKRKNKKKTNKRRKTIKRRKTLKKF